MFGDSQQRFPFHLFALWEDFQLICFGFFVLSTWLTYVKSMMFLVVVGEDAWEVFFYWRYIFFYLALFTEMPNITFQNCLHQDIYIYIYIKQEKKYTQLVGIHFWIIYVTNNVLKLVFCVECFGSFNYTTVEAYTWFLKS